MSPEEADREKLLADILSGAAGLDSPEVLDRLERDPELRRLVAERMPTIQGLDRLGSIYERTMENLDVEPSSRTEERRRFVADYLMNESERPSTQSFFRWSGAIAAVLLLALTLWIVFHFAGGPGREIPLGERPELIVPLASDEPLDVFRWRFEDLPPGGFYKVTLVTTDGRLESDPIRGTEWRPPSPPAPPFEWFVTAYEASGEVTATSIRQKLERSP